jgi:hypothetical protein
MERSEIIVPAERSTVELLSSNSEQSVVVLLLSFLLWPFQSVLCTVFWFMYQAVGIIVELVVSTVSFNVGNNTMERYVELVAKSSEKIGSTSFLTVCYSL